MNWKNKVILISGGTSGMGLATARILLGKGACVVINGRDTARGEEALAQLGTLAGNCQFVPGDVSREEACRHMVQETLDYFGRLDGLVTSAGYYEEEPNRRRGFLLPTYTAPYFSAGKLWNH